MPRTELFLGNLARDVVRRDIENIFDKYCRLLRCDLKNRGKTNHFWCINTIKSLLEIYILYIFVLARRLFVKVKCFPFNKNYRIFKTLYCVIRLIFPLIKSYVKTKKLLLTESFQC